MFVPHDIARDLSQAGNSVELFEKLNTYSRQLGFEYCCYGFRASFLRAETNVRIYDTYPQGWMAHYQRQKYVAIDPTVAQGASSPETILWPTGQTSRRSAFWRDAREHGLVHGVAQPSWSSGGMFGLLSFARGHDKIGEREFRDLSLKISWLANLAHSLMSRHILADKGITSGAQLTAREREVLLWTTEGMNAAEIAQQLNISISTVNWHVSRILEKLEASNKVQAASRAIALGLI
jgi:LuxR family transcriptional regulator, quorum-sensing system regulator SolR